MRGRRTKAWEIKKRPQESQDAYNERVNYQYFNEQLIENEEYWKRFGTRLHLSRKIVLDLGCGHGALSLDVAKKGAAEVVGIDLDANRISFARKVVEQNYPNILGKVTFHQLDITETNWASRFDAVVSKDSFEHIEDLKRVLGALATCLKPNGLLIVGFSPLYFSPYGDHSRLKLPVPWIHAFLPDSLLLMWVSWRLKRKIETIMSLGLNKITPSQFRTLVSDPRWEIVSLKYNCGNKPLLALFSIARHIPLMERFFTVSIYAVLRRAVDN